eukprot:2496255-Pleurochrysis_carterae.AAC.3
MDSSTYEYVRAPVSRARAQARLSLRLRSHVAEQQQRIGRGEVAHRLSVAALRDELAHAAAVRGLCAGGVASYPKVPVPPPPFLRTLEEGCVLVGRCFCGFEGGGELSAQEERRLRISWAVAEA